MQAKIESNLIIEEVTSETCRQTLEGSVEIKIIGLGHVVEKIVVDNLRNVYKGVPHIVERCGSYDCLIYKCFQRAAHERHSPQGAPTKAMCMSVW